MKISISRSGGFSGISLPTKALDTADPTIIARAWAVAALTDSPAVADGLTYTISITGDDGKVQTKTLHGEVDNEDFQELLRAVI